MTPFPILVSEDAELDIAEARDRAIFRKLPYFLLFNVFSDAFVVFGCMHMRRDPEDWKARG